MLKQAKILFFLLTILTTTTLMGVNINVTNAPYNADNTGVADATEAIQDAIDDATASGDNVYLPAGTYLISSQLTVANNLNNFQILIFGDGRTDDINGTIIRATADMDNMLLHYENKIYLYKIRFEGNQKAKTIIKSGLANTDGTSLPKLKTITVKGSTEIAVESLARMKSDGVTTGVIDHLIVESCGGGVIWYGDSEIAYSPSGEYCALTVDYLQFLDTGSYNLYGGRHGYYFGKFDTAQITNIYVYSGNNSELQLAVSYVYDCVLDGGYIDGILRGPTAGYGTRNFTIKNYTIKNCYIAISTDLREDDFIPSAIYDNGIGDNGMGGRLGGIITNNNIDACSRAWFCQGSDISFTNNVITNCPGGPQYNGHNTGILRFNGSQGIIVGGGNYITGLNNKRIIYATYNVAEPDISETSLIYHYKSLEYYESTTSPDYVLPDSEIIIVP